MLCNVPPDAATSLFLSRLRSLGHVLIAFAVVLIGANLAFGQANINEGLESAYIYVNGTTGNDSNSGSESDPLKTISAATSMAETNNHSNIGSLVTIEAGTYRETVKLTHSSKDTTMP